MAFRISAAGKFAAPYRRERVFEILVAEARDGRSDIGFDEALADLVEKPLDDFLAEPGILAADRRPRGAADGGARLAGDREPLPGGGRHLRLRADDLDLIAIVELGDKRRMAAVDAAADAAVADAGMDRIGEIDRRRAARQAR